MRFLYSMEQVALSVDQPKHRRAVALMASGVIHSPGTPLSVWTIRDEVRQVAAEAHGVEMIRKHMDAHWARFKVVDLKSTLVPMAMIDSEVRHSFVVQVTLEEVWQQVVLEKPDAEWNF